MVLHTALSPRVRLRRSLGILALAAALPLAACNGTAPSDPSSTAPSESATPSPAESGDAAVDPTGKWTSPEAGDPFLEFSSDGTVVGTDGCNRISTTWTVEGETIIIEDFVSTQKACAGVDTWLSKASSATIHGDVMKVKDSQGSVIGGLEKAEEK